MKGATTMLFRYKAMDGKTGQQKKGKLEQKSREDAIEKLKEQRLHVTELVEVKQSLWTKDLDIRLGKPVKQQDFVVFCRQLATLLNAGTSIVESIRLLADQTKAKPFKEALNNIHMAVRAGTPLSEACQDYPRIFDKVFIYMVRAGELSGELDEVMDRLATFFEKEHDTREKVKSALTYPVLVGIISCAVVIFLLTNIIPKLVGSLVSAGGSIPLPTAIVIGVSDFLIGYWYALLLVIFLLGVGYRMVWSTNRGRYYLDYFKLKIPIYGSLLQKSIIARMTRTLASLFASAVPVLQSLTMVSEIVNNEVMAKTLRDARQSLRSGDSLSAPLAKSEFFPKIVSHMIAVGEETGQIDTMLEKIADFYESDVDHVTSRLSKVIEPIMIVILAVIVGTIMLAALLPMFEIYKNV
jgi:type IV pilus assembly protein PilC